MLFNNYMFSYIGHIFIYKIPFKFECVFWISTFILKQFIVKNFFSKKKIYKDGINIDHEPNKNKKGILDGEGDFVDYEEVD